MGSFFIFICAIIITSIASVFLMDSFAVLKKRSQDANISVVFFLSLAINMTAAGCCRWQGTIFRDNFKVLIYSTENKVLYFFTVSD